MITFQVLTSFIKTHASTAKARYGLYGLTALESVVFPIPVDPLLAACVYARSDKWISIGILTALCSVVGGVVGWYLGFAVQILSQTCSALPIRLLARKSFLMFQLHSKSLEFFGSIGVYPITL